MGQLRGFNWRLPTVNFSVATPPHWDRISKDRIQSHFVDFKLGERFSVEAANELAERTGLFDDMQRECGVDILLETLRSEVKTRFKNHPNSWQTALYQALVRKFETLKKQTRHDTSRSDKSTLETCPRCSGNRTILGSGCDACDGAGAATATHFASLEDSLFEPVSCPSCIAGSPSCQICRGEGRVSWQRAKDMDRESLVS